jgi:hypothetical protein
MKPGAEFHQSLMLSCYTGALPKSQSIGGTMNGEVQGLEQIQERLMKLERQNRRSKQVAAAALLTIGSFVLMGQTSRTNVVEASQFILKDKGGKVRATLSVDDKLAQPVQLVFYDGEGRQKVKLDSGALPFVGGALHLADENGKDRIYISSSNTLGGTLSLLDAKGLPGTVLNTNSAALPDVEAKSVALKDTDGNIRARWFMTEKHIDDVTLPGMSSPVKMTVNPSPTLAFYDLKGKPRLYMDGEGNVNAGSVGVSDSQGQMLGSFMALADFGAMLALDNGKGQQRLLIAPGHLEMSDDEGFETSLGVEKNLVTVQTGETHQTSAASLILFDRSKHVIWKAP